MLLEINLCCGCRSCEQSCPRHAIIMEENYEGFLYPKVVPDLCVQCGLCLKKCPKLCEPSYPEKNQSAMAIWLKDDEKLSQSTSGGAFAGFAERVLEEGGVVFGAAYDEHLSVKHIAVRDKTELSKLKGSKYVESNVGSTFTEVKGLLQNDIKVLYSGTPCQIAGLKSFLGKEYHNLLTVDLICHGVPSRKLFSKWLDWKRRRLGGKISYCGFRDKDVGGYVCVGGKVKIKTKTKISTTKSQFDPYYASFMRCETYRESCYTCPYSNIYNRPADISIGDFHELRRLKQYNNEPYSLERGVSLIVFNSKKGLEFFDSVKNSFNGFDVNFKDFVDIKSNVKYPSLRPEKRNHIYEGIDNIDTNEFFRKFRESSHLYPLRYYISKIMAKVISISPLFIKKLLNNILKVISRLFS